MEGEKSCSTRGSCLQSQAAAHYLFIYQMDQYTEKTKALMIQCWSSLILTVIRLKSLHCLSWALSMNHSLSTLAPQISCQCPTPNSVPLQERSRLNHHSTAQHPTFHTAVKENPWLWVMVKIKSKLHAPSRQWLRGKVPIPKGKNWSIKRCAGSKARPNPRMTDTKSCSPMSDIQSTWRWEHLWSPRSRSGTK